MTLSDFNKLQEKILKECQEIMDQKGLAYSGKDDKLGNFKRGASLSGSTMEKVWFVYFTKHFDSLASFIRNEYLDSEPIKGRIKDMINYLLLLCGILKEQGRLEKGDSNGN